MLVNLHVKNMALIEEIDLSFEKGLNVITGETGAGKSLLLGSVHLALGGKFSQEMLRNGTDSALAELVFSVEDPRTVQALTELGYPPEDGQIIISRKLSGGRAVSRVNGETCTASALRQIAELLITIHGQRENQTLLKPGRQLEMLDTYGKTVLQEKLLCVGADYDAYTAAQKALSQYTLDEEARKRELSMLEYELAEIEEAGIAEGEEDELEKRYRKMTNARTIVEALGQVHRYTGYDTGAGDMIGRAVQELSSVAQFDDSLSDIASALNDVDAILDDINRQTAAYLEDFSFSEQEFRDIENRLDKIHTIQSKYGSTVEKIRAYETTARNRLAFLNRYEEEHLAARMRLKESEESLEASCGQLSRARKKCAAGFEKAIRQQLTELNFAQAELEIQFTRSDRYRRNGFDEIELLISTNPGEPVRPLAKVASGGELSRIMLAIRNILADEENTETLIFDEIDAGISGRTAQKVSEKMASIASGHQILCVTHLAQIAAMADTHFLIEKQVEEGETRTTVRRLEKAEEIGELARILGGAEISEAAFGNAREMKKQAGLYKAEQKNGRE